MDHDELVTVLDEFRELPSDDRIERLVVVCRELSLGELAPDPARALAALLVDVVESGRGVPRERVMLGEVLGHLGDPRLSLPGDDAYWVCVPHEDGDVCIGRYPVTNAEYRRYVDQGGYDDLSHWSDQGRQWLASRQDPWPVLARSETSSPLVVANQPVVGVTWYEAEAYARWAGFRLVRFDERLWATRGAAKRPYPWGSPFGEGNANTREEVLGRPCAVGLYTRDRTPEGACDLAGNAGEWTADGVGRQRWIHPGSWDQPSMAAWAKARSLEDPDSRWAGLGLRLARDA